MTRKQVLPFLKNNLIYIVYIILTLLTAYLCFANLGVDLIQNWDEARHGVSGYEMSKTNE